MPFGTSELRRAIRRFAAPVRGRGRVFNSISTAGSVVRALASTVLALSVAAGVLAQNPAGVPAALGREAEGKLSLAAVSEVQEELKLSPEVRKSILELRMKRSALLGELVNSLRNGPPEERMPRLLAFRDEGEKLLGALLKDGESARLTEILLRRDGLRAAATRPDIASRLMLSGDQLSRLKAVAQPDRPGMVPRSPEARMEQDRRIAEVYTEDQRRLFATLQGAPFQLPIEVPAGARRPQAGRLKAGEVAPDFVLADLDGKNTFQLASFRDKKPVVLVFGSVT